MLTVLENGGFKVDKIFVEPLPREFGFIGPTSNIWIIHISKMKVKRMEGEKQEVWAKLKELIGIFKAKGALSPETAMTAIDLGLPPRFEEGMRHRLGSTGIFVEVDGKYYLSEQRLAEGKAKREEIRERIKELVQLFKAKRALSAETAMTAKDLGLPPRFEEGMKKRLGQSGIFVEINGKYYLSEQRLAERKAKMEERRQHAA